MFPSWWRKTVLAPLVLLNLSIVVDLLFTTAPSGRIQSPIAVPLVYVLLQHEVKGVRQMRALLSVPMLSIDTKLLLEYGVPLNKNPTSEIKDQQSSFTYR